MTKPNAIKKNIICGFGGCLGRHPLLLIFLLLPLIPASLNYSGFCMKQKRWISDEEKIRIVLSEIIRQGSLYIETKDRGTQPFPQVRYSSVAELLEKNPNCCISDSTKAGDNGHPTFWDKVLGRYTDVLVLQYKGYYVAENREVTEIPRNTIAYIDNCAGPERF